MDRMNVGPLTWKPALGDLPLFTCTYSFGPGIAHTLAAACEGGFAIISPPCNAPDSFYAETEKLGKVRAIVAPNAYHNMGIAAWKARFPDAGVFAPAQSIARVEKKGGVSGVKPLADAKALAGAELELVDMPHYKTGEVLARFKRGKHVVWYVTDVIMNLPIIPPGFPIHQMFKWTKSAPGLRPNGIAAMFMVKDKASLYRWMRSEVEAAPPTLLVPCHGDAITERPTDRLLEILPS
jgi:hypothetical protein